MLGDLDDTPGRRLAVALARRNTSLRALATQLGVDASSLSRFVNFAVPVGSVSWERIGEALDTPPDAFKAGPWGRVCGEG